MTDNENIKALECCTRLNRKCYECPLSNDGAVSEHCISVIRYEALDLIKRQQVEIERLREVNAGLALSLLHDIVNNDPILRKEIISVVRSEAINKFAEKLKHKCRDSVELDDYRITVVTKSDIDALVEEMVVDKDV